jgi:anaerobic magnesium-protoporphyrin IX monomethyl ester cyclase
VKFSWICETHPNLLTAELIVLMARAGCVAIKFGIESGDLDVMHKSHRHTANLNQQEAIVRQCEKNGIDVLGFYILGYRDDTRQTVLQTIDYAQKLNTFGAQFTIATPYPGTPWYQDMAKQPEIFALDENLEKYTQYKLVYQHPNIPYKEMEKLKSQAYQQYYLRPAYITKHLSKILRS